MKRCFGLLSMNVWMAFTGMAQTIIPGQVQRVACQSDSSQQYALYVPQPISADKAVPLLLFFDPAANGDMPVSLFRSLANEYGVIMAGSFNSRNFNGNSSEEAFVAMFNDVVKRFTIDPKRIWLAGFSGGARAASSIAWRYPEIAGVIGCGAGFAGTESFTTENLKAYAGIVGDLDMNYSELLDNSRFLSEKRINNILLVYAGGHTWPPSEHFGIALEWLLKAATPTERGNTLLESVKTKIDSGYLFTGWVDAMQLSKVGAYRDKAIALAKEAEKNLVFLKDKQLFEKAAEEEMININQFSLLFSGLIYQGTEVADDKWKDIAKAVTDMLEDKNRYRRMAGQRCMDHCRRSCQEQYYHLMQTQFYDKAMQAATVLNAFISSEYLPSLLLARSQAALGKKKPAEKYLKESIKKGLSLTRRVDTDAVLLKVFSKEEIQALFK